MGSAQRALLVVNIILCLAFLGGSTALYVAYRRLPERAVSGAPADEITFWPPVDAVVQAVKGGHVVLSVGRDNSEVKEGFRFTVYRGDRFIGKVQVIKVYAELAGAKVIYTSVGESIEVGDKAATRL